MSTNSQPMVATNKWAFAQAFTRSTLRHADYPSDRSHGSLFAHRATRRAR